MTVQPTQPEQSSPGSLYPFFTLLFSVPQRIDFRKVWNGFSSGLDPLQFLENNDSYGFFSKVGSGLVMTGHTGTNLMDIQILSMRKGGRLPSNL